MKIFTFIWHVLQEHDTKNHEKLNRIRAKLKRIYLVVQIKIETFSDIGYYDDYHGDHGNAIKYYSIQWDLNRISSTQVLNCQ